MERGVSVDTGRTAIAQSPMRAAIARRMVKSKREAPHFYVETTIAMDSAAKLISGAPADGIRITMTSVLIRACALALTEHPKLNAVWGQHGLEQVQHVNVGVAVAVPDGLVAPALLGADSLRLRETALGLEDLVARTRAGKLRSAELSEATFTLSNLGMFDVSSFTAIVVPPQICILATGTTKDTADVVDGQVVVRPMMTATVSADHRALDGADVAAFLMTFKSLLENAAAVVA